MRQRLGEEAIAVIESEIFDILRVAGVIKGDSMLTNSAVLPGDIIYTEDVGLIFKALGKMRPFAETRGDRMWSLLCQAACNLKRFHQLYFADEIGDESLKTLGLAWFHIFFGKLSFIPLRNPGFREGMSLSEKSDFCRFFENFVKSIKKTLRPEI